MFCMFDNLFVTDFANFCQIAENRVGIQGNKLADGISQCLGGYSPMIGRIPSQAGLVTYHRHIVTGFGRIHGG